MRTNPGVSLVGSGFGWIVLESLAERAPPELGLPAGLNEKATPRRGVAHGAAEPAAELEHAQSSGGGLQLAPESVSVQP